MFNRISKLFRGSSKEVVEAPSAAAEAPFECLAVPGKDAATKMQELRGRHGCIPVLLGCRSDFAAVLELSRYNTDSLEKILEDGLRLDVDSWVSQRLESDDNFYAIDETVSGEVARIEALSPTRDALSGKPKKEVLIGLIPVENSWSVPAYLKLGDWNGCPGPAVHVAMFRRWNEKYGAEVTTVTNDVIEFSVASPPATHDEARALAIEQFAYCGDIVQQGVGTFGNLAVALVNSKNWYFWWD